MGSGLTVLIISNLFPPVVSGSSIQSSRLARELVTQGNRVIVITAKIGDSQESHEINDTMEIFRIPSIGIPKMSITWNFPWIRWTLTLGNLKLLNSVVKKYKPDIIHLHNHMFDLALSAAYLRWKYKIPLVITIHTIVQHPNRTYNAILCAFDRIFLKKIVVNPADMIICPEKTIFRYVRASFNNENVIIIPYGIDIIKDGDTSYCQTLINDHNLKGKKIFLSLGHVHEIRDRKDIIEAMPDILQVFPDFILLIVGDVGTEKPRILAKMLGVEKNVIFTGAVPHSVVPSLFAISEMNGQWFKTSNPQSKTLGIAALEAMSAGKVVIGTADADVYGEKILINNENVILTNPGEPHNLARIIIELLRDDNLRKIIGSNASRTIKENFSWTRVGERTVQLYLGVISNQTGQNGQLFKY